MLSVPHLREKQFLFIFIESIMVALYPLLALVIHVHVLKRMSQTGLGSLLAIKSRAIVIIF